MQKYEELYRNLQKEMVKKVAHMAVKYDLKSFVEHNDKEEKKNTAFVEHNDKEEKKNTYPTAKKRFSRGSLRF